MTDRMAGIEDKRRRLAGLIAELRPGALNGFERVQRIDITFTSNALEGSTLTAGETALVLEKGLTVSGKPLKDHLEAVDHAHALDWIHDVARDATRPLTEGDVRDLHRLVMAKSAPDIAGRYADLPRTVNTEEGPLHFPSPAEVPAAMATFATWLTQAPDGPVMAFEAHRRLVTIHPFNDGNGRTARLLMNLVLLRAGYPAVAVRPEERPAYIAALEHGARDGYGAFDALMLARLDATLDAYLHAAAEARPMSRPSLAGPSM